mgnify:CR=1 FL=1
MHLLAHADPAPLVRAKRRKTYSRHLAREVSQAIVPFCQAPRYQFGAWGSQNEVHDQKGLEERTDPSV